MKRSRLFLAIVCPLLLLLLPALGIVRWLLLCGVAALVGMVGWVKGGRDPRQRMASEEDEDLAEEWREQKAALKHAAEHSPNNGDNNAAASASPVLHRIWRTRPHRYLSKLTMLDVTPLIRITLSPTASMPYDMDSVKELQADLSHLSTGKAIIVRHICGPRSLIRLAKAAVGPFRPYGLMSGMEFLRGLRRHERYNFILADRPRRLVLSHVGHGEVGGLCAKHALLAELGPVVFAGELVIDDELTCHVNNNSGTYRPTKDLLPQIGTFLQEALQIKVVPHERTDDKKMPIKNDEGTT